eukprot:scaffold102605_cov21-Tisochrysis_lutea.AAC.2
MVGTGKKDSRHPGWIKPRQISLSPARVSSASPSHPSPHLPSPSAHDHPRCMHAWMNRSKLIGRVTHYAVGVRQPLEDPTQVPAMSAVQCSSHQAHADRALTPLHRIKRHAPLVLCPTQLPLRCLCSCHPAHANCALTPYTCGARVRGCDGASQTVLGTAELPGLRVVVALPCQLASRAVAQPRVNAGKAIGRVQVVLPVCHVVDQVRGRSGAPKKSTNLTEAVTTSRLSPGNRGVEVAHGLGTSCGHWLRSCVSRVCMWAEQAQAENTPEAKRCAIRCG